MQTPTRPSLLSATVFAGMFCFTPVWAQKSPAAPLAAKTAAPTQTIGFYTPDGVSADLVGKVQFTMINFAGIEHLAKNLKLIAGSTTKLNIDVGPLLALPKLPTELETAYTAQNGKKAKKVLAPLVNNKLRKLPSDKEVLKLMAPILDQLIAYKNNVGSIFIADEPYLSGISRQELERVAQLVRKELNARGLNQVKLGVIFASGMFDARFAQLMNQQALNYVQGIDSHYNSKEATKEWKKIIPDVRLTTYDSAGNMYTQGGLPKGFEVVGFDFYVSTALLDLVHDMSMSWFATKFPEIKACQRFKGMKVSEIKKTLSFFQDGPVKANQAGDAAILDDLFACRMGAVTKMLKAQAKDKKQEFLLISESSNNGLLEFSANGTIEKGQPPALVEARVLDEVKRGHAFYQNNQSTYKAGLMYFTYENTYDKTIALNIGGAAGMRSVMSFITEKSAAQKKP